MPYIITTSEPFDAAVHVHRPAFTRRAVATLDEAREKAESAVWSAPGYRSEGDFYLDVARCRELPESGGTVGPLPDGTVIEVEATTWRKLAIDAWPGVSLIADTMTLLLAEAELGYREAQQRILDAYNARQT